MSKRPWFRLHLSTCLFALCALFVLVVLNLVGNYRVLGRFANSCDHGWPCAYLHRQCDDLDVRINEHMDLMPWGGHLRSFRPWLLAVNVAAGSLILAGIGGLLESRRRRRTHVFQFNLWEWCGLFLVTAVAFGYARQFHDTHQQALRVLQSPAALDENTVEFDTDFSVDWEPRVPGIFLLLHDWWYPWQDDYLASFCPLHRLVRLEYSRETASGETSLAWLQETPALRDLRLLELAAPEINDSDLEAIGRLEQLQELHLRVTRLSGQGMRHLAQLKNLRLLVVSSEELGESALQAISQLEQLEELSINTPQPSRAGLDQLAQLEALRTIELPTHIGQSDLAFLAELAQLESLKFTDCEAVSQATFWFGPEPLDWSEEAWANLGQLMNLRQLDFSQTGIATSHLVQLQSLPCLTELNLSCTRVGLGTGEALAACRSLKRLDVSATNVEDGDIRVLSEHPKLDEIDWTFSRITEDVEEYRLRRWPHSRGGSGFP